MAYGNYCQIVHQKDQYPLLADSALGRLELANSAPASFSFLYHERKDLGDVQRSFECSTNFQVWNTVTASALIHMADLGDSWINRATFPAPAATRSFYRVRFSLAAP